MPLLFFIALKNVEYFLTLDVTLPSSLYSWLMIISRRFCLASLCAVVVVVFRGHVII